jgi:GH24 family phage-related lysozyme (muramidase)
MATTTTKRRTAARSTAAPRRRKRKLSKAGVRLIAGFEGFRSDLYDDAAGHCTIGYGHLVHMGNCDGSESSRASMRSRSSVRMQLRRPRR